MCGHPFSLERNPFPECLNPNLLNLIEDETSRELVWVFADRLSLLDIPLSLSVSLSLSLYLSLFFFLSLSLSLSLFLCSGHLFMTEEVGLEIFELDLGN